MSRMYFVNDGVPRTTAIGTVARYPMDDCNGHRDVAPVSRDIVDRFVKVCDKDTYPHALLRALARRLACAEGGITAQSINMLYMLMRINDGEPIRETDPLFSEMAATEPIPTTDLRVSE